MSEKVEIYSTAHHISQKESGHKSHLDDLLKQVQDGQRAHLIACPPKRESIDKAKAIIKEEELP